MDFTFTQLMNPIKKLFVTYFQNMATKNLA